MSVPPRVACSKVLAQGRIDSGPPVAVIDIGSNSVRLVVYEGLTRSLTPIFNEKVLAGLGREVLSTGLLAEDAVDQGAGALVRFRALVRRACGSASCGRSPPPRAVTPATAASSSPGPSRSAGCRSPILSGRREAELSALGIVVRLPQAGRHRRRSRRRLAGTDRRARRADQIRADAAARRPRAAGPVVEVARQGGEDHQGSARRRRVSSRPGAAAISTRSAAPGGR